MHPGPDETLPVKKSAPKKRSSRPNVDACWRNTLSNLDYEIGLLVLGRRERPRFNPSEENMPGVWSLARAAKAYITALPEKTRGTSPKAKSFSYLGRRWRLRISWVAITVLMDDGETEIISVLWM